jgi:glycosyltransferase involved in cell wall biosynthesis
MEPENNIEFILDGFHKTNSDKPFIVIGNTKNKFGKYLVNKYKNDSRIRFTGALFNNKKLRTLISFCYLYFHGHSVGGTNPSLLEAMAGKALIAAHNNLFNRSVLNDDAFFFDDITGVQNIICNNKIGATEQSMIENNYAKINKEFNWNTVIKQYESFFYECFAAKNNETIIFGQRLAGE